MRDSRPQPLGLFAFEDRFVKEKCTLDGLHRQGLQAFRIKYVQVRSFNY